MDGAVYDKTLRGSRSPSLRLSENPAWTIADILW